MPLRSKLALLFCLSASPLAAQTTIHVPADQRTIQAAIDAARSGDTVLVSPGTYTENIDFKGKAITLTSAAGPATTVIQGGSTDGVATVFFHNGETTAATLSGFTITGGGNPLGGGYPSASSPYGGAFIAGASPTVLNNVFTGNHCSHIVTAYAAPTLRGNRITNLLTQPSGQCYSPTAVYLFTNDLNGGSPTLTGNTIENNVAAIADAGGVVIWSSSATLIGNTIRNNTGQSGGVAVVNTDSVAILNNLIYGNTGTSNDYDASGGISILAPYSTVGPFTGIIASNTIANNTVGTAVNPSSFHGSEATLDGNLAQFVLVNNILSGSQSGTAALGCASPDSLAITPLVLDHNDFFHSPGPTRLQPAASSPPSTMPTPLATPASPAPPPAITPFSTVPARLTGAITAPRSFNPPISPATPACSTPPVSATPGSTQAPSSTPASATPLPPSSLSRPLRTRPEPAARHPSPSPPR